jgi:hypothetical protein
MGKYTMIGDEGILDFVNNKHGKRFNFPKFGDKLTVLDVVGERAPKKEKPFKIPMIKNLDYIYTYIEYSNPRTIKGVRVMTSVKRVKGFIGAIPIIEKHKGIRVYYQKRNGNYSPIYDLK